MILHYYPLVIVLLLEELPRYFVIRVRYFERADYVTCVTGEGSLEILELLYAVERRVKMYDRRKCIEKREPLIVFAGKRRQV